MAKYHFVRRGLQCPSVDRRSIRTPDLRRESRHLLRWKLVLLIIVLVSIAAISEAPPLTAHAATTRVWTGAVNLNWSTPGNWSPAGAPIDGDSVVIGAAAAGKTLANDIGYFDVANNRTWRLISRP